MAVVRRMRRRGWMNAARKATPHEPRQPVARHYATHARVGAPVPKARAYIFDVEGTLVDTVLPSLNCWCQTLAEFGFSFRTADLHRYSGIDSGEVLPRLLPQREEVEDFVVNKYTARFRAEVLPTVRAFAGARDLIAALKLGGAKIALATTSPAEELAHYRSCLGADELVDAYVSGDDVKRGKPHPDVILAAMKRLSITQASDVIFVGDTPYDAEAAQRAGVRSFGMLSGHFPRADLLGAGCAAVFLDAKSLRQALAEAAPALA